MPGGNKFAGGRRWILAATAGRCLTVSITEASDFRQSPLAMAGLACLPLSIRLVSAGRCWSIVKDIQEHTESTLNGIRGPIDYFNLGSSLNRHLNLNRRVEAICSLIPLQQVLFC
jgi:hypothetical protein